MQGHQVFLYPDRERRDVQGKPGFSQVADVEAEMGELKARGVVFEECDMPGVEMRNTSALGGGAKTAWFKDTEGSSRRSMTFATMNS